jgi:amidase
MTKSVYDAALILETMVLQGKADPEDPATDAAVSHVQSNYTQYALPPYATFSNMTLAIPREFFYNETISGNPPEINEALDKAIALMKSLGATIVDNATVPSADELATSTAEGTVLDTDFKVDLAAYLARLNNSQILSLEDLINFNDANADIEFAPGECCQQTLIQAVQTTGKNSTEYIAARAAEVDIGRTRGIDYTLDKYGADALVLPTEGALSCSVPYIWILTRVSRLRKFFGCERTISHRFCSPGILVQWTTVRNGFHRETVE